MDFYPELIGNWNASLNSTGPFYNATGPSTQAPNYDTPIPRSSVFKVAGTCRNCIHSDGASTFLLYDDAFQKRQMSATEVLSPLQADYSLWSPQGPYENDTLCVCPAGVQPTNTGGVTLSAFRDLFQARVKTFINDTVTTPEEEDLLLIEARPVDCGSNVSSFTSDVYVRLGLTTQALAHNEIEQLENIFQNQYNRMTFYNCEMKFRLVNQVQLTMARSNPTLTTSQTISQQQRSHRGLQADLPFNAELPVNVEPVNATTNATNSTLNETILGHGLFSVKVSYPT